MTSQSYKVPQGGGYNPYEIPRPQTVAPVQAQSNKSDSAFRTISEVADHLGVQQHVLRFWETKFSQVKPLKRGGGRRYYRPEDVELLKSIHHLLYTQGYTIKGVQKLFREQGKTAIRDAAPSSPGAQQAQPSVAPKTPAAAQAPEETGLSINQRDALKATLAELKELRRIIRDRG